MVTLADRILLARAEKLRRRPDWLAAVGAGLCAGAALSIEMAGVRLAQGRSVWELPRMTAALLLGPGAGPPPDGFDAALVLVSEGIHAALSIFYSFVVADAVCRLRARAAPLAGAAVGAVVYLVNLYGFTLLFPWFAQERGWAMFLGHLLFGATAAAVYKALETPVVRRSVRP